MRILIVEDNEDLAFNSKKQLLMISSNTSVDVSLNGKDAIELLNQNIYDILLLDIVLPDIDGLELLRFVRGNSSKNKDIFIIITTGITHNSLIENANKLGADYFITKPYQIQTVNSAIEIFKKIKNLPETLPNKDLELEYFAYNYLSDLKIPLHLKGYGLLVTAFKYIVMTDNAQNIRITKDIYPYLAKHSNTDISNVERNIRNAIASGTYTDDSDKLSNLSFLLKMRKSYYTSNLQDSDN